MNTLNCQNEEPSYQEIANRPHSLRVGDILRASWGYEQTNVDYYEVIRVSRSSVWLREIGGRVTEHHSSMSGKCVPVSGEYLNDEIIMRRANGHNMVRIEKYARAYKWMGKADMWSGWN